MPPFVPAQIVRLDALASSGSVRLGCELAGGRGTRDYALLCISAASL
jgi:hypothetical protein